MKESNSVCRTNGNRMEFFASQALIKYGIKPNKSDTYTIQKIRKFKTNSNRNKVVEAKMYLALSSVIDGYVKKKSKKGCILRKTYDKFFYLNPDGAGSSAQVKPTTSDIVVVLSDAAGPTYINLSIKNNNLSLKHQMPNKLWLQLQLKGKRKQSFIEEYAKINAIFYKKWKNHTSFSQVSFNEKSKWYTRINNLTKKYLLSSTPTAFRRYISFIMDLGTRQKYIIRYSPSGIVDVIKQDMKNITSKYKITVTTSFLKVSFLGGSTIKMRLHNCQSKITKMMGLKYDTTLVNGLDIIASY